MSKYFSIAHRLPRFLSAPLCGKREWSERNIPNDDPDWLEWQSAYMQFYQSTQKSGLGKMVNDSGYKIASVIDLSGRSCLEIGPGIISHMANWQTLPAAFDLADVNQDMLDASTKILSAQGITTTSYLLQRVQELPFEAEKYDVIFSFYSLEHLNSLPYWLGEYRRVLKVGGCLVGAIPTEGGLAWGIGRFCTSRRYVRKKFSFDFDKITAIEHCNTAEQVLTTLERFFYVRQVHYWPFCIPLLDANLTVRFICQKE